MKKVLFGLMCVMILFIITGCGLSSGEKQKRENYYAQAKENAVNYIENKYGFTPKIEATKCTFDNSDNFSSSCNEEIIVNAKYNNKSFKVIIDGSKQTKLGIDNYQYDEIVNDLIKIINKDFGTSYKYQFYYGSYYGNKNGNDEGLIDTYYDGNNLFEIMENSYLRGVVEYIDGDNFENLQDRLTSTNYSILKKLYIVNYDSLDSYKKVSTHDYNILGGTLTGYFEDDFYDNSDYLKDVIVLYYKDIKYYNFK